MAAKHWIELAIIEALSSVDPEKLMHDAAIHVQVEEDSIKAGYATGKIRPSLLSDQCPLSQMKKMHGHGAQPGFHWIASRNGRPNAGTGLNFIRGWLMEGLVIACLQRTGYCKILGKSPEMVFRHGVYEAHPDVVVYADNQTSIIQIKNPNVHAFARMEKQSDDNAMNKYLVQTAMEMYVGRKMGLPINQAHILAISWESWPPSTTTDHGLQLRILDVPWAPEMEGLIEHHAEALQANYQKTLSGEWPQPFPESQHDKFPCSYCNFSRLERIGITRCDDIQAWKKELETTG
jgi:hypothetical protein